MLNYIWLALILLAVVLGGATHQLKGVTDAAFAAARTAVVDLALPLVGITALWLGLMRLADRSGLIQVLARTLRPLLRRLFPDVPPDHPAMGSMLLNMSANLIGLTNAATPLGLRAMKDLESLNPHPGTATNAMCTFLAINTGSLQLVPLTAIGILSVAGSTRPTAIIGTALLATACAQVVGITSVKLLQRLPVFRAPANGASPVARPTTAPAVEPARPDAQGDRPPRALPGWGRVIVLAFVAATLGTAIWTMNQPSPGGAPDSGFARLLDAVSTVAVPFLIAFLPLYAALRGIRVYEEFVEGAREGFQVAVRIIPFLVAMLVAVGMFRAAGGVGIIAQALQPMLDTVGFPSELLPMALTRPLSGSATIGLFADLVKTSGPDSLLARMGGTLLGSTETTFYVLAVYFGSVGITRTRHAVAAGLLADLAGIVASVTICRLLFASH